MKIPGAARVTLTLPAVVILFLAGCAGPGAGKPPAPPAAAAPPATPVEVFHAKCSRCHAPEVAYAAIGQRERWVKSVSAMSAKDPAWIDPAQIKTIIAYFDDHPAVVNALFAQKCASCHQWGKLRQLDKNPGQWRTMINFMGHQRSPGGLTREEAEILFRALSER